MSLRFRVVFALSCAVLTLLAFTSYAGQVRAEAEKVRSDAIARYGGEVVSLVVTNRQIEAGETVPLPVPTTLWAKNSRSPRPRARL